jgi:GPH family glycoside/pentoside/hexuronide:cation symporter
MTTDAASVTEFGKAPSAARVKVREKIAYSLGDVGSNVVLAPATAFFLFYLTTVVGLDAGIAGTIILVGQLLNGVIDLVVGYLIDRTDTRWGKARPWVLLSAVPLAVAFVLMFSVPGDFDTTGKIVWTFAMYTLVMAVFFTASNVAYGTLMAVITPDPKVRVSLGAYRFFAAVLTNLLVGLFTLPIVQSFGNGQPAWTMTAVILGVIATITLVATALGTRERVVAAPEERASQQRISKLLSTLVRNPYFWLIFILGALFWIFQGVTSAAGVYYAAEILGDPSLFGLLNVAGLIPTLVVMPFMPLLMGRLGKRNAFLLAAGVQLVGVLLPLFAPENFGVVLAGLLVRGLGLAPFAAGLYAATADVIDFGEWRFGVRADGLIFSGITVGIKVGSGVGAALVGWMLSAGGYVATAAVQPDSVDQAILALYIYIPIALVVLIGITTYFFRVERYRPQIEAHLATRTQNTEAAEA